MKRSKLYIFVSVALFSILFITSCNSATNIKPKVNETKTLPVVGTFENLKSIISQSNNLRTYGNDFGISGGMAKLNDRGALKAENSASDDFSRTNIQVQGVDEADVAKTDDQYIYQITGNQLEVIRAYPAAEMKIVSTVRFDENFQPTELYIDSKYLTLIGMSNITDSIPGGSPQYRNIVKTIVFSLQDKSKLKKLREAELEGYYVSSRKIGSSLYLVANKYIDYYSIMEKKTEPPKPMYRDTAGKNNYTAIDYGEIHYFPGSAEPNYLLVGGLNLEQPEKPMSVSAYLGAGQNVYASPDNLYISVSGLTGKLEASDTLKNAQTRTSIYKFSLNMGQVTFSAQGEVQGTLLNQFSMDESNGNLRLATTQNEMWSSNTSKNNVYVLDKNLNLAGHLDNIAPGERIYSTRFMGDRAYMVTFRQVDPLFVLDLKDPKEPKILGSLKIPGYSDYLHPYDENHIIGFGKNTTVTEQPNSGGTMAYYQGMKVALFDVSDVKNPVEKFKEIIGDRGTTSELLQDHKALLFNRDKNLLAFPVTVMEVKDNKYTPPGTPPQYGQPTFQGAYVYNLDLKNGFKLRGKITHVINDDYDKRTIYDKYIVRQNIYRIMYIKNTLYSLSKYMVKAHDLTTLQELKSLSVK